MQVPPESSPSPLRMKIGIGSHGERTLRAVGFLPLSEAYASRKQRGRRGYPSWHFHREGMTYSGHHRR